MSIEINNESGVEVDEASIQRLITFALDLLHVNADAEVAIVLVDEAAMEQLHVQWMDEPGPTDVLSFPMDELRPGTEEHETPAGPARRHRRLPAGRAGAGGVGRSLACSTRSSCSPRTASCTCSASITRSRTRSGRCSACSATSSSAFATRRSSAATPADDDRPLLLLVALLLVAFAGLLAAADSGDRDPVPRGHPGPRR